MKKINKRIQIVRAAKISQSSMGQKSCQMIADVLRTRYQNVSVSIIDNTADLQSVVEQQPDLVFLGLKRTNRIDLRSGHMTQNQVWVSEYLTERGVAFTGSEQAAIALDLNKDLAKRVVQSAGLPTAPYFMALPGEYHSAEKLPLGFPLFIKPPTQGGGTGIAADSIAHSFEDYERKVLQLHELFGTPALVETYLVGREFSVAVLGDGDASLAMPIELIAGRNANGDRILGSQIKADDTEQVIVVEDSALRAQLISLATDIYREIGARDYGRIDFRMNDSGTLFFLEANLIPGLANHDFISYFTHACLLNETMAYEDMILRIAELSLARYEVFDELVVSTIPTLSLPVFPSLLPLEL